MLGLFSRHGESGRVHDDGGDEEEDRRAWTDDGMDRSTWAEDDRRWAEMEQGYLQTRSAWLTQQGRAAVGNSHTTRRDVEDEYNFYYMLPRH